MGGIIAPPQGLEPRLASFGVISPKDFGATGNGTTDDTAAWQAWVNALGTNGAGYVPAGTYSVTSMPTIPGTCRVGFAPGAILLLNGVPQHRVSYYHPAGEPINVLRETFASGSSQSTTGSITAGQKTLTVASAAGWQVGHGISILGAGAAITISAPGAPTVTPTGTAGSTAYSYAIVAGDGKGGWTAVGAVGSTNTGNATLSSTNYNALSWTAVSGAATYAVFRTASGGTPSTTGLIALTADTSLNDTGLALTTPPAGLSQTTPPSSALADLLVSQVVGISGTTLFLKDAGTTTVNSQVVAHDDGAALNAAYANGGDIYHPAGTYVTSLTLKAPGNTTLRGPGSGLAAIKAGPGLSGDFIDFTTGGNVQLVGLTLDGGRLAQLNPTVVFRGYSNAKVRRCIFQNFYYVPLALNYYNDFDIEGNLFTVDKTFVRASFNAAISLTVASGDVYDGRIARNVLSGMGMNVSGHDLVIADNDVSNYVIGSGITTNQDLNTYRNKIIGNTIHDSSGNTNTAGIENWGPDTVIEENIIFSTWGEGITNYGDRCIIAKNLMENINQSALPNGAAIDLAYNGTSPWNSYRCVVSENETQNTQGTNQIKYGVLINVSVNNATICGNKLAEAVTAMSSVPATCFAWGNEGYNPVGHVSAPAVPASGTAQANTFGVRVRVFVSGGTVSAIAINGTSTGLTSGSFELDPGETITLTYTAAPTWTWFGL